jgi:hypothetical protein
VALDRAQNSSTSLKARAFNFSRTSQDSIRLALKSIHIDFGIGSASMAIGFAGWQIIFSIDQNGYINAHFIEFSLLKEAF